MSSSGRVGSGSDAWEVERPSLGRLRRQISRLLLVAGGTVGAAVSGHARAQVTDVYWNAASNGLWSSAANWSSLVQFPDNNTPAGATYRVFIDVGHGGPGYTVTLDAPVTIDDLTLNSSAATLSIERALTLTGTLTRNFGSVRLSGGSINGGVINLGSGGSMTVVSNTANAITGSTVNGSLVLSTSNTSLARALTLGEGTTINGDLTINGDRQRVEIAANAAVTGMTLVRSRNVVSLLPGASLSSGTMRLSGSNAQSMPALTTSQMTDRIVIGAGAKLEGGWGVVDRFVENHGVIAAIGSGTLSLSGAGLENTGTLRADTGGTLSLLGSTATSWSNQGSIVVNGGTLNLGGQFTIAGLGAFTRTGGAVNITGTLSHDGSLLSIPATMGPFRLKGGTIRNAEIDAATSGVELEAGTLRDVLYRGDLNVSTSTFVLAGATGIDGAVNMLPGRYLYVSGPTVLTQGDFRFESTSPDTARISGSGTDSVRFDPATAITVRNGAVAAVDVPGQVYRGLVTVADAGSKLRVWGDNQGTMTVSAGAELTLGENANGSRPIPTSWRNTGVINVDGGTLKLSGQFGGGDIGTINRNGGTVLLAGTVNNDNQTMTWSPTTGGGWTIDQAKINGGTLSVEPGGEPVFLPKDSSFTERRLELHGVTLRGSLPVPQSHVNVQEGLTLDGGVIAISGDPNYHGMGFFRQGGNPPPVPEVLGVTGTGEIRFSPAGNGGPLPISRSDQTEVRIGAGVTVSGSYEFRGPSYEPMTNHGRFVADISGKYSSINGAIVNTGTIEAGPGSFMAVTGESLVNSGTLRANGGTLVLGTVNFDRSAGMRLLPGSQIVNDGGDINLAGVIDLEGRSLVLDAVTGSLNTIGFATLKNGTLEVREGGGLTMSRRQGPAFYNGYGGLVLDNMRATGLRLRIEGDAIGSIGPVVTIRNGLTGNAVLETVSGRGQVNFLFSNSTVEQTFEGTMVLDPGSSGSGSATLSSMRIIGHSGATLRLAPSSIVRGGGYRLGSNWSAPSDATLINEGLISADLSGKSLEIFSRNFVNRGTFEARNGARLVLHTGIGSSENPRWANEGVMRVYPGSSLQIGGTVATAQIGQIENLGGQVLLRAAIDNTGATWSPNFTGGEWLLGGQIKGGVVNAAHPLTVDGVILDGVEVNGDLHVPSGTVYVKDGPRINGEVRLLGSGSQLVGWWGTHRLESGTIVFDGAGGGDERTLRASADGNVPGHLTLAPGVTIRGGHGRIYTALQSSVINEGLISADVPGQAITIDTVRFSNYGVVQAVNGGQIVYVPPPPLLDPSSPWTSLEFVNDAELFAATGGSFNFGCPVLLSPTSVFRVDLGAQSVALAPLTAPVLSLGGTLVVGLSEGWSPQPGVMYRLFESDDVRSSFLRVSLMDLQPGWSWDASRLDQGVISVIPAPGGLGVFVAGLVWSGRRRRSR